MCNLFHVLLQVYVYLKKRYWSKILLFNCFILLYTTYRDRAIFVQGKIRALKVALYLLFIYVKDVSSCGII